MGLKRSWQSAAAQRLIALSCGASTVEEAVIAIASKLLKQVAYPPTDLNALGAKLGVVKFTSESLPVAGELRRHGADFEVVLSSGLSFGRRRFTIAHELAHALFEQSGPGCPRHGKELESICDMLAGELLMPTWAVKPLLNACDPKTVLQIASSFGVSRQTTAIRCKELSGFHGFEVSPNGELVFTTGLVRQIDDYLIDMVKTANESGYVEGQIYVARAFPNVWRIRGTRIGTEAGTFFTVDSGRRRSPAVSPTG
jgi:hypothetical protein